MNFEPAVYLKKVQTPPSEKHAIPAETRTNGQLVWVVTALQCTAAEELPASPGELTAFSSSFPMHKHLHSLMSLQHSHLKI